MGVISVSTDCDHDVAGILSAAFADDPVMAWISDKPEFVPTLFHMVLPAFIRHGLTYVEAQGRGAASWLGPGAKVKWPYLRFLTFLRVCGIPGVYRLLLSGAKIDKYHPRDPHYYLFAIGAPPAHQGQGVGSLLIAEMLRRCDREQVPAYLENSKEANLAFYQGHGFEVIRQIRFAKDAPPLWLMWREPRQ